MLTNDFEGIVVESFTNKRHLRIFPTCRFLQHLLQTRPCTLEAMLEDSNYTCNLRTVAQCQNVHVHRISCTRNSASL